MAKHREADKPAPTYTLSQRQRRWLIVCFFLIGAAVIWLGAVVAPQVSRAQAELAQLPLMAAYFTLAVLFIQWGRQAKRAAASPFLYVDAETGEAFTPVGERMEV
jgi:hypothetical protein